MRVGSSYHEIRFSTCSRRRRDTSLSSVSLRRSPEWRCGPSYRQPSWVEGFPGAKLTLNGLYEPKSSFGQSLFPRALCRWLHIPTWTISCGSGAVSTRTTSRDRHYVDGTDNGTRVNILTGRASCCHCPKTTTCLARTVEADNATAFASCPLVVGRVRGWMRRLDLPSSTDRSVGWRSYRRAGTPDAAGTDEVRSPCPGGASAHWQWRGTRVNVIGRTAA